MRGQRAMGAIVNMFSQVARLGFTRAAAFFYAVAVGVAANIVIAHLTPDTAHPAATDAPPPAAKAGAPVAIAPIAPLPAPPKAAEPAPPAAAALPPPPASAAA